MRRGFAHSGHFAALYRDAHKTHPTPPTRHRRNGEAGPPSGAGPRHGAAGHLADRLRARGLTPIGADLTGLLRAGGSVRSRTPELRH
ncbi:hypothetical protein [Kitasatospora sp. NBC_01560]|uniref:hypothetical protein n=1 Tax=Kitasatospora sp. NBC_01560 TaxID=2975965 RepID=UPI00386804B8